MKVKLFTFFLLLVLIVSGCSVSEDTTNDASSGVSDNIDDSVGDLDQLEQDLDQLDDIDVDQISF